MDELDRLRAFRPAPEPSEVARARAALALLAAVGGSDRRRSRPVALIGVLVAAAAIATGAYALYQVVIVGSPAPASVQNDVERMENRVKGLLIPQAHQGAGIEVAKTRAAAVITTSVGPMYLWVAPNTRGDSCAFLQIVANDLPGGRPNLSGGCFSGGTGFYVGINATRVNGRLVGILQGRIGTKGAKTVEVQFASGESRTFPVTNDYVLGETSPSNAIETTTVRNSNGRILARRHVSHPLSPVQEATQMVHRFHPVGPMRTVATLRTIGKHRLLVEKTAPGTNGTTCHELVTPSGTGGGCGPPIGPTNLDIGPTQIGSAPHGWFLFDGPVGKDVRSLELRFEDGTHVAIPIQSGFILYQVNPRNFVSGHRPTELVARDGAGRIVRTRKFGFLR